jgi:uncharacterized protein (DUF2252 family)
MRAASTELLSAVDMGKASYLVKSLQPTADRVDLAHCSNFAALRELLGTMAHAAAWAHLRGCGHQAADRIEQLQAFAGGTRWRTGVLRLARHGCAVSVAQWKAYADDYREARGGRTGEEGRWRRSRKRERRQRQDGQAWVMNLVTR